MSALSILSRHNLNAMLRGRGLGVVLLAVLVPPLLTGAWVFSHQHDLVPTEIAHEPLHPERGQVVNITAVIENQMGGDVPAFNVTIRVGYFEGPEGSATFRSEKSETQRIEGLAAGQRHEVRANWTAQAGTYIFQVLVDTDDELPEIEERNNDRYVQAQVKFPAVTLPPPPERSGNSTMPTADLAVRRVTWEPQAIYQNDNADVQVLVENLGPTAVDNATVSVAIYQASPFGYSRTPSRTLTNATSLAPGANATVHMTWRPTGVGQYALLATIDASLQVSDPDAANDVVVQETFIDRRFVYEPPEAKATVRDFYSDVLGLLHLKILIPLVALFFVAGTLEDERNAGNLPYLLTRPVPRWTIPVSRFLVSLLVGGAAVILGVVLTYLLLLGVPQGAAGALLWPLLLSVVALAAYAGLFMFFAVAARRPYLVGVAYVLGLEVLIFLGRSVTVNGRPLLQDWVANFALSTWLGKALEAWKPNDPFTWWPEGADPNSLLVPVAVAVAGVVAAALWLTRREIEA